MSSRRQATGKNKAGRKKLALSKETLKDLTAAKGAIKGGARDLSLAQACTLWPMCKD